VSYKILEEVFRGVYTKLERRIGTSEARSVLPIWFLCGFYQNHRYYRAWVGKTTKGSLARPRVVTSLTGGQHRSDRWCPAVTCVPTVKRIYSFTPHSFSLLHYSQGLTPSKPWKPLTLSYFTSLKTHGDLKIQPRKDLKIGSKRISQGPFSLPPFEFFGFLSSSSLQRYSNLHFARSLYSVQRFQFPLVYHLLRTSRRHTYGSITFCWTHCEDPRYGVGRPSPV
jgi:hypothetical protein